jgi:hypothetical protein
MTASADTDAWRRWLRSFLILLAAFGGAAYLAVLLLDPFATGRFTPLERVDIASRNMRLARAGLVRDPAFDGAVIGNSTAITLDPSRIGEAVGRRIVQLSILAALPPDEMTVARAFDRHHRGRKTISIFMLDQLWCLTGEAAQWGPFPNWLYEGSDREYLSRIFFPEGISTAATRAGILLGLTAPAARADGYDPVNRYHVADPQAAANVMRAKPRETRGPPADAPFPAIDALESQLAAASSSAGEIFVFGPVYVTGVPAEGSPAAARLAACKERVRQLAAQRPNAAFLDLLTENAITRDVANFYDEAHYRPDVARWVEAEISRKLGVLTASARAD